MKKLISCGMGKLLPMLSLWVFLTSAVWADQADAVKNRVRAVETITPLFTIEPESDPFRQPSDVEVDSSGNIYVLDGVNNRVVVFDKLGRFLYKFGRGGYDEGEFNFPLGLTLDSRGRIFVADSGNHRVQAFTNRGRYLFTIDLKGIKERKPSDPTDVVIDETRGLLYIVDNDNHKLYSYDLIAHRISKSLGEMSMRSEGFRWPFSLALDSGGYIYIVDVINTRVRVVSPEWRFTIDIGGWGVDRGQFFRPKGVALDSRGRVYVSDSYLGVIQVFDRDGRFLTVLGDNRTGEIKKFETPTRLFVDKRDRLYVVEMFANRVSVYKLAPFGP